MKEGYTVGSDIDIVNDFILVSNYEWNNEVMHCGFNERDDVESLKTEQDIGVWKIKQKKI